MSTNNYHIITSGDLFADARELGIGHLLIQGDSGGETFLTCPIRYAKCAPEDLFLLMLDLESLSQAGSLSKANLSADIQTSGYDAWIICAEFEEGESYQGGEIRNELWVNDQFEELGLREDIRAILSSPGSVLGFQG